MDRLPVHIRWMHGADLPEVVDIEEDSFEYPFSEKELRKKLRCHNTIGMVAESGGVIVGYMLYALHRTRLVLESIAVSRDVRRRGVGTQMVKKLISKLNSPKRERLTAYVRETNLPAQLFLHRCGLRATSVLREFYTDLGEDAYLMVYRVPVPASSLSEGQSV